MKQSRGRSSETNDILVYIYGFLAMRRWSAPLAGIPSAQSTARGQARGMTMLHSHRHTLPTPPTPSASFVFKFTAAAVAAAAAAAAVAEAPHARTSATARSPGPEAASGLPIVSVATRIAESLARVSAGQREWVVAPSARPPVEEGLALAPTVCRSRAIARALRGAAAAVDNLAEVRPVVCLRARSFWGFYE